MKVLFLCTGNACRSQMAEGWARKLKAGRFEAFSAGVAPCYVHPLTIEAMAESGVDISGHYSKHVEDLAEIRFDYVVTLCDYADGVCPDFPGFGKRVHRPFEDPVTARGSKREVMEKFRSAREKIRAFVEGMPENLEETEKTSS